ncbi:hypothetical protein [Natronospora cellulosivora (SeqCode)]
MYNQELFSIISNNLQTNGSNYSKNEVFSTISILVLLCITEIYQGNEMKSFANNSEGKASINNNNNNNNNTNNLGNLLGQFQGNDNKNALEQMLPLLLSALGGNTNTGNLDIGNILSLINNIKPRQNINHEEDNNSNELDNQEKIDEDKKKNQAE